MLETVRRGRLVALYVALLCPWIVVGAVATLRSNANSPLEWVPPSFPPRADFDEFRRQFGSGDLLIASWPTCYVDQPILDDIEAALSQSPVFRSATGAPFFDTVTSGRDQWRLFRGSGQKATGASQIPGHPLPLIGKDHRSTCLVIGFTAEGLKSRGEAIDAVRALIHSRAKVRYEDIHLAGPVIDGHSVDIASQKTLNVLALPSALLILVLAKWCLRSWRAAGVVFGISTLAQAATLALVHYGGDDMSALLIVLPPLIQVLAVAGSLHLANYYFEASATAPLQAAHTAWRQGWLPSILSGGTTAIGLASLGISQLTPIRAFARYGSAGMIVTTALVLAAVPFLFAVLAVRHRREPSQSSARFLLRSDLCAAWMQRHAKAIVAMNLCLMIVAGVGVVRLHTSVRIETLFPPRSRILRDYAWLENRVGPVVPIEVLLSWNTRDPARSQETYELKVLRDVAAKLAQQPHVGSVVDATTWLAPASQPSPLPAGPGTVTPFPLESITKTGYLRTTNHRRTWRITAYVSALEPLDYSALLNELRNSVLAQLDHTCGTGERPRLVFTGTMPLVHAIQQELLRDLFVSLISALGLVTIVMTVVQGSIVGGLLTMLPNVFPIAILFGLLGWRNTPLDIGSVMTASVALGIAVDDTVHFVMAFRRHRSGDRSAQESVRLAYRDCARAMIQTSVVCGLGMLVFSLSDFVPTRRFAWMMAALLAVALAGDLIFLPAILLSPFGKWMSPPRPARAEDRADTPPTASSHGGLPSPHAPVKRPVRRGKRSHSR